MTLITRKWRSVVHQFELTELTVIMSRRHKVLYFGLGEQTLKRSRLPEAHCFLMGRQMLTRKGVFTRKRASGYSIFLYCREDDHAMIVCQRLLEVISQQAE